MSSVSNPPQSLLKPMVIPQKLLMGPGPSNSSPRILSASALPMLGHLHPEFTKIMDEVKEGTRYLFQTRNNWTVCVSGTGHAAMEAAVCAIAETINKPMGQVFNLQEIEEGLQKYRPVLLFLTHGESSGSTVQPLEGVGKLCHREKVLKRKTPVRSFYFDMNHLSNYWGCEENPRRYKVQISGGLGAQAGKIWSNEELWDTTLHLTMLIVVLRALSKL
ncbi:AGXT [Mytilus edulis]|uniref:AGXT n=1 Tax=Mytilus edulis TaxID=6550 RepID=A0A8S3SLZ8_MYTED|nr:AGXT [Mytilus edulis]